MKFSKLAIPGAFKIELNKVSDNRGSFERVFCSEEFKQNGLVSAFVQSNISYTSLRGTFRGLHIQKPPFGEVKVIRCIQGVVCDFLLDLRVNSPTFLKWVSIELSRENNLMVYIPEGVAHGFQATENNSELLYFHSKEYNKQHEMAINYSDPLISLTLPIEINEISERDLSHPFLKNPIEELNHFQL